MWCSPKINEKLKRPQAETTFFSSDGSNLDVGGPLLVTKSFKQILEMAGLTGGTGAQGNPVRNVGLPFIQLLSWNRQLSIKLQWSLFSKVRLELVPILRALVGGHKVFSQLELLMRRRPLLEASAGWTDGFPGQVRACGPHDVARGKEPEILCGHVALKVRDCDLCEDRFSLVEYSSWVRG